MKKRFKLVALSVIIFFIFSFIFDTPIENVYAMENGEDDDKVAIVCIVVGFTNCEYKNDYNYYDFLFSEKSEDSVAKYFLNESENKFTFIPARETCSFENKNTTNIYDKENDGIIHVNLDVMHKNWEEYWNEDIQKEFLEVFEKALKESDKYIEYSQYDKNNNGVIDKNELVISYSLAGYDASYSVIVDDVKYAQPPKEKYFYPHAWEDALEYMSSENILIKNYIAIAEDAKIKITPDGNVDDTLPAEYSVIFVHELGHYLGLSDYWKIDSDDSDPWKDYDVKQSSKMCSTAFIEVDDGFFVAQHHTSFDAFSKVLVGWTTPTVVTKTGDYEISAITSDKGYHVLKIPTERKNEYYLAEVRDVTEGYDRYWNTYMPDITSTGILLWHIDEDVYNEHNYHIDNMLNYGGHHPALMPLYTEIIEAENNKTTFLGTVDMKKNFLYSKERWPFDGEAPLVLYPDTKNGVKDVPENRTFSQKVFIKPVSAPGKDMTLHVTIKEDAPKQPEGNVILPNKPISKNDISAKKTESKKSVKKKISIKSLSIKKGKKKISGKLSVRGATVKIKVGAKRWKKAKVSKKKFSLKVSKLRKKTVDKLKISKKGYYTLNKKVKVR